ncbi:MAG: SGNH/GDSL hydrolase family protein [Planctomycetota bacterium]
MLLGIGLILDGHQGAEVRHRAVAYLVGILCAAPALTVRWFGARASLLWRRLSLSIGAVVVASAGLEVTARSLELRALAPPGFEAHAALGRVHLPNRGSIDAWGFRNASVPERADVVCLGDSQTYGENIRRADAYPQQLAARIGRPVYNMSLGGYGPLQMEHLIDQALSLKPRLVVLGFYLGNDLADAHRFAALPHWASLRDPALSYEELTELAPRDDVSGNLSLALIDGAIERSWVLQRLTYDLKLAIKSSDLLSRAYGRTGAPGPFDDGPLRTQFSAAYRLGALDLQRDEIRDGLRITEHALGEIARACAERGTALALLIIPTKERLYHELLVRRALPDSNGLERLGEAEAAATLRVEAVAQAAGIRVLDPTPALLAALEDERALWPKGSDGHLNAAGCAVLAEVLATEFERVAIAAAR